MKIRLAVMASGSGTNAHAIFQYFEGHPRLSITALLTNNPKAGACQMAEKAGIPTFILPHPSLPDHDQKVLEQLIHLGVHGVVLAGYLKKIPAIVVAHFPDTILNIHPALLPDFGGKGMFGAHVHEAVLAAGKTISGITIHVVNAAYDQGPMLLQVHTSISQCKNAVDISKRVQALEHYWYPRTIEWYFSLKEEVATQPIPTSI